MIAEGCLAELVYAGYTVTINKTEVAVNVGAKTFIYKHDGTDAKIYTALQRAWAGERPDHSVAPGEW